MRTILLYCLLFFAQLTAGQNVFHKADSLLKQKEYKQYSNELLSILNLQDLSDKDRLEAHRYVMQHYNLYEENADSLRRWYAKAMDLAENLNSLEYQLNYQQLYVQMLINQGEYQEALALIQKIEPQVEKGDYDFLPHLYDNYARLLYYLQDYEQAFEKLKKEASLFEAKNEISNMSAVYNNLGILYKSQGILDSSLAYHQKSLDISLQRKDTLSIIQSYNNIGQTYETMNQNSLAASYYRQGYQIDPDQATVGLIINYSHLLYLEGDFAEAERLLLDASARTKNKVDKQSTLGELINLYKLQKDYKSALNTQEELLKISKEILDETKIKEIERLKVAYETEKKENEIKSLRQQANAQKTIIRQNKILVITSLIVLSLVIISFILYLLNRATRERADSLLLQQKLLRNQMNPHFIFNTLSNIQSSILQKDNNNAIQYLVKFSKMLRHNLQNSALNEISLSDELQSIRDYVELQKLRMTQDLRFDMQLDSDIEADMLFVPSMLLQPIIENAIEHGLKNTPNPKLALSISAHSSHLHCIITDNGVGYSTTQNQNNSHKTSVATSIIEERLKILSQKNKHKLEYHIDDIIEDGNIVGTKASIDLPTIMK